MSLSTYVGELEVRSGRAQRVGHRWVERTPWALGLWPLMLQGQSVASMTHWMATTLYYGWVKIAHDSSFQSN